VGSVNGTERDEGIDSRAPAAEDRARMTERVVSLIASATEIVCALGEARRLVGRSHECDFPPSVKSLPVLTEPKFKVEGSSGEIDRRVKALLAEALSVYRVDPARLEAVRPDVIITQTQCEVCAVSLRDVEEAVCTLPSRPRVVALSPNSLGDIWTDIVRVARALGVEEKGAQLVAESQARMAAIAARARALPRQTVALVEWIDPLMAAGNWMPTLTEMAGGIAIFGEAGKHSPWMSFDALAERDPDLIVILPCGFDIARSLEELHLLTDRPGWAGLSAARAGRVYVADGNQYFNRPGPRVVESLEILAELCHPEIFDFGHRGVGWVEAARGLDGGGPAELGSRA
jgi:iron complex transport system substrate-binding protein